MEPVRDIELYRGLEQALGANVATALMDRLPPQPVQELATKTDLRTELAALRQELKGDIAMLDQRMTGQLDAFRQEINGGFATFRKEINGDFATLRQEMNGMKHELMATVRGEMIDAIHTQGRQLAFTLAGSLVGLSGLAFAVANLAA